MAKRVITNDMEYWQLKEDYGKSLLAVRSEEDKKKKKELEKEAEQLCKLLVAYEKKKIANVKSQQKDELKRQKIREKKTAKSKIFFEVSPIEGKYIDYSALTKVQRNKLAVKKESLISSLKKGMYVRVKGDTGIYQIKNSEKRMGGMNYISTVVYGDVAIQDIVLILSAYYYEQEVTQIGHLVTD